MTNKKEYDRFSTQLKAGKLPVAVSEYAQSNRLELFNIWMESGGSWESCRMHVERAQQQVNSSTKGWAAVQGKELRKRFPDEEKFNKVVQRRKEQGLFYEDDLFPSDVDDS